MIYLDHAASTPLWGCVLEVLIRSSRDDYANPSSSHKMGRDILKKIEAARKVLLDTVKAGENYELFFTSSATESNNMVIKGLSLKKGDSLYVSEADHPSVVKPSESLKYNGVEICIIPMDKGGKIDKKSLLHSLKDNVKLLILSHVNNQSGNIYNVERIAAEAKKRQNGIHIHVDGVQGFGKLPFSIEQGVIDSYSVSSHKIGGPKGTAALYLRKGVTLQPLMTGGGQEGGMRSSTRSAPLILGFREAVEYVSGHQRENKRHVAGLNKLMRELLSEGIPGVIFPFSGEDISPYILNLIIPGISSDIVVRHLEQKEIYISTTSACSSGNRGEDKTFTALSIPEKYHNSVYRVSFSKNISEDEVTIFSDAIISIYKELSELL